MLIAGVIGAVFVVVAIMLGIALGAYLPFRVGAAVPGFHDSMPFGLILGLLPSMLAAQLFGGWGEALLGTNVGIPFGLFAGAFIGMAASCLATGAVGATGTWLLRRG